MRTILFPATAVLLLVWIGACGTGGPDPARGLDPAPDPMDGARLFADVERYTGFGVHRTAHPGDLQTASWVRDELERAGFEADLLPWKVNQVFLEAVSLEADGTPFDAFPAWYPNRTGPVPLVADMALFLPGVASGDLHGRIAYIPWRRVRLDDLTEGGISAYADEAAARGAAGLCVPISSLVPDSGRVKAGNVRVHRQAPQPVPTLFVAPRDDAVLEQAARGGARARMLVHGEERRGEEAATAYNVVARIRRGPRWIVVTTPLSGWFGCGGERGPGVALFLGLARWAGRQGSDLSLLFLANSGHELGYLGAEVSLAQVEPPEPEEVAVWIHLGAAIATRAWKRSAGGEGFEPSLDANRFTFLQGSPEWVPMLRAAFAGVPHLLPGSLLFLGELEVIREAGYSLFGFFGEHHFFHQAEDTAAETAPDLLEPVGRALVDAVRSVEKAEQEGFTGGRSREGARAR